MFVTDDFNALIQPGIIVQKQVLVMLCFGKRTIVIFLVRLAVLADKSDEEYYYRSLAEAEYHKNLFLDDDSGLYERIEIINDKH